MIKGNLLYEGKAKTVFETDNPQELLVYFKDDARPAAEQRFLPPAGEGVSDFRQEGRGFRGLSKSFGLELI